MTRPSEVVARARSAIGHGCVYALGKGGFDPTARMPFTVPEVGCDCSGFAAWCVGVRRLLSGVPHYQGFGDWFETTALVRDARSPFGFVNEVLWTSAKPGMLVVWGDHDGMQGHVGVVSVVDATGPIKVVHCSKGNWRSSDPADAIRETAADIFRRNNALVADVAWVTQEDA